MLLTYEKTKALIDSVRDYLSIEAGDPISAIEDRFKRYEELYLSWLKQDLLFYKSIC